jgi:hypothetical protein
MLRDGKVLIVGSGTTASSEADIYDPADGTFTSAGNLTVARASATATLLADGRVLIAGGDPHSGEAPSKTTAELYDPSTGTFTRTADLLTVHIGSTATLLRNGKVLIAGGYTSGCCPAAAAKAELFDPITGTFSFAGQYAGTGDGFYLIDGPSMLAATLLSDGRVLLPSEPQSEIYDPDTDTFSLTGKMTTPCVLGGYPKYIAGRTATLLVDGKVVLTGGEHEDCGRYAEAEIYDPATGMFSQTGRMARVRDNHRATLLRDGTVLITGGESVSCDGPRCTFFGTVSSAEVYNSRTGIFTAAGNMMEPRAGHTSTLLLNGDVLITGGYSYAGIGMGSCCFKDAELYKPISKPPTGRRRIAR